MEITSKNNAGVANARHEKGGENRSDGKYMIIMKTTDISYPKRKCIELLTIRLRELNICVASSSTTAHYWP